MVYQPFASKKNTPVSSSAAACDVDEWNNVLEFIEPDHIGFADRAPLFRLPETVRGISNSLCGTPLFPTWSPPYFVMMHLRQRTMNYYLRQNYSAPHVPSNTVHGAYESGAPIRTDPFLRSLTY